MDRAVLALVVLNLLLSIGLIILVLRQRGGAGGDSDVGPLLRSELQQQSGQIRQEQQEQRAELSQMLRVTSESQSVELARQLQAMREGNEAKLEKVREA